MDGVLNLDKPAGITSFQAVSKVRRITGAAKSGHAGTLDPFATGVLPIMLGKATRIAEYFLDCSKQYRAQITLGIETDTLDITGSVTGEAETGHITIEQIQAAIPSFIGEIQQLPPVYSAIKINGKRMYQMARGGLRPEPVSRMVAIYKIEIVSFCLPFLTLDVTCGRGTYIRSLARDLGLALESRGHLSLLERTAYGPLGIGSAVSLNDIEQAGGENIIRLELQPMDIILGHLPVVELTGDEAVLVAHGGSICRQNMSGIHSTVRAYDEGGKLVALLVPEQPTGWYKPRKVFADSGKP
ncbi:MAG: tRNA pseudouridine(55) synthase TruB [Dehalococcoidales bacterium]|nr:tRNA pseudouridine(55) synthase TruB [Dehalococcoidales bacterium]MDD4465973.1 tRNA pseudouridine(55) synthase TruB [Dehalococcoidales bacterium]MDD5402001.1 tRNA pseudouridine(55) synthase TruB [Dehalococcoidales bacterium]